MRKVCSACGYKSGDKDIKCPICGGMMLGGTGSEDACDPAEEKEWNGGYHNDFEEGRKTGEYCDPKFEKYVNGAEHYHGTEKTTANKNTSALGDSDASVKAAVIMTIVFSIFFPIVCPLVIIKMTKEREGEAARAARIAAGAMIAITLVTIALYIYASRFFI